MRDFLFGTGPRPLKSEALRLLVFSAIIVALGMVFHWNARSVVMGVGVIVVGTIIDHFRPSKKQPVTRYTNPRYTDKAN